MQKYKIINQELIFDKDFNESLTNFIFPENIKKIQFGYDYNKSIKNVTFPDELIELKFNYSFNKSLQNIKLPDKLELLELGEKFNYNLYTTYFPKTLRTLIMNIGFFPPNNIFIPSTITELSIIYSDFNCNTYEFPLSIKKLLIRENYYRNMFEENIPYMNNLPVSLEDFTCPIWIKLKNIPNTIKRINFETIYECNKNISHELLNRNLVELKKLTCSVFIDNEIIDITKLNIQNVNNIPLEL